jgi:hypothetical protein
MDWDFLHRSMRSKLNVALLLLGIECAWYAWSAARRRRMLEFIIAPRVRQGALMDHKPLSVVCLVHILINIWRAWMRHSTGARVCRIPVESGGYGIIWVWRPLALKRDLCKKAEPPLICFPGAGWALHKKKKITVCTLLPSSFRAPPHHCGMHRGPFRLCCTPAGHIQAPVHACLETLVHPGMHPGMQAAPRVPRTCPCQHLVALERILYCCRPLPHG